MKSTKLIAALALVVTSFTLPSGAAPQCPSFTIKAQPGSGTAAFAVTPAREDLTYNWSVSAGSIVSGQGTANIVVSTAGIPKGESVQATVEIGDLDAACAKQSTLSSSALVE